MKFLFISILKHTDIVVEMSVDTLSQPLHVVSTRIYESGPASLVVKPEQLSINKQEELTISRKKEKLTTKQIETHVKREILVDQDGNIIDAGDPNITTNTTEDVKVDETETNELKTTGGDSPGPDWVIIPGSKTVNEKVHRTKINHVIRDEKTEAEETEGLPNLTNEEYQRVIAARRRNQIINGPNYLQSPPVTETVVETEELREVSEALGDVLYSTDKSRTSSRERSSSPYSPITESDKLRRRRDLNQRPRHSPPLTPTRIPVNKPISSVTTGTKTSVSVANNPVKQKDTSRWIQNHFGETPTRVTTVLQDAPSPVHISNDNPHLGKTDDNSSTANFSAIKDFFQTAVEKTENYYNGRSNVPVRRDRTSKLSGSSSGSNGRVSHLTPKTASSPTSTDSHHVQVVNIDRTQGPTKWGENGTVLPRTVHRQHSNEETNTTRNFGNHDNYSAYSTIQRVGHSKQPNLENGDQELSIQKIINSLRSSNMRDSSRPNCQSPTMTSSRMSPEGKHVIKINVNSSKPVGNLQSPKDQNLHYLFDPNERPKSAASYLNDDSPSRKLKMRVNGSSNLRMKNSLNRSTPSLNHYSSPPPPLDVPAGRSLSSLALNHIDTSNVTNTHSLPRGSRNNKSSIWISNNMEARRQKFMEDLLDKKDLTDPSPKPPPRRHHKSNNIRHSSPPPLPSRNSSQPPPLRRPTSPDPRSSPGSFYYLGEQDIPPRSESPVTRTEKTVKRKVTTSKTRVNNTGPYRDHYDRRPTSPLLSKPINKSRV